MATQAVALPPALPLSPSGDTDPNLLEGDARIIAWAERLARSLDARAQILQVFRDYYEGIHPKTFATAKWLEVFGEDFGQIVDNWGAVVVDAATTRMLLNGFRRIGSDPKGDGTDAADDAASAIWRRSRMHVQADVAHTDGLATGYSYVSVHRDKNGKSRLRVEDPMQTIVEHDPETGIDAIAGLKRWRGVDGRLNATVYLPDLTARLAIGDPGQGWKVLDAPEPNPHDTVPLFEFANNPNVRGEGRSDQMPILTLGDAEEKLIGDMVVASEFAAFPQRVILGGEVPEDDDGNPVKAAVLGVNRLFAIEQEGAKIQEFSAADLSNYVTAIEMLGSRMAALTNVPPHYMLGKLANLSGDALAAAESGLVSKVRRRIKVFGETWADAMTFAYRLENDGEDAEFVTLWENPERVSDAQKGDYLVKLKNVGVPDKALWEEIKDPAMVTRWSQMRDEQDERLAELDAQAAGISGPSGLSVQPRDPTLTE